VDDEGDPITVTNFVDTLSGTNASMISYLATNNSIMVNSGSTFGGYYHICFDLRDNYGSTSYCFDLKINRPP
jgi:hypothetical protein